MSFGKCKTVALAVLILAVGAETSCRIEKTIRVNLVEERHNGKLFVSRVDDINGEVKRSWAVDGASVSGDEYDQAILTAEMEDRRLQRKQEDERLIREQGFARKATMKIAKRLLEARIDAIGRELDKIDRCGLGQYCVFGSGGLASQDDLDMLRQNLLPRAKSMVNELGEEEPTYDGILEMERALEPYEDKLQAFFRNSFNNAISTCNDTRRLKELLEVVA